SRSRLESSLARRRAAARPAAGSATVEPTPRHQPILLRRSRALERRLDGSHPGCLPPFARTMSGREVSRMDASRARIARLRAALCLAGLIAWGNTARSDDGASEVAAAPPAVASPTDARLWA